MSASVPDLAGKGLTSLFTLSVDVKHFRCEALGCKSRVQDVVEVDWQHAQETFLACRGNSVAGVILGLFLGLSRVE